MSQNIMRQIGWQTLCRHLQYSCIFFQTPKPLLTFFILKALWYTVLCAQRWQQPQYTCLFSRCLSSFASAICRWQQWQNMSSAVFTVYATVWRCQQCICMCSFSHHQSAYIYGYGISPYLCPNCALVATTTVSLLTPTLCLSTYATVLWWQQWLYTCWFRTLHAYLWGQCDDGNISCILADSAHCMPTYGDSVMMATLAVYLLIPTLSVYLWGQCDDGNISCILAHSHTVCLPMGTVWWWQQ